MRNEQMVMRRDCVAMETEGAEYVTVGTPDRSTSTNGPVVKQRRSNSDTVSLNLIGTTP